MSSCMPSGPECQEDFPGVLVQQMILHRRVAQAPMCTLPLLYTDPQEGRCDITP
jgi:hypothetical protein